MGLVVYWRADGKKKEDRKSRSVIFLDQTGHIVIKRRNVLCFVEFNYTKHSKLAPRNSESIPNASLK